MTVYTNAQLINQRNIVTLHGSFTVGASGAPTLVTANGASNGIKSITRSSAGVYTITLGDSKITDKYKYYYGIKTGYQFSGTPTVYPQPVDLGYTQSTSRIQVRYYKPTASSGPVVSSTVSDPDNGATIYFEIMMGLY